MADEGKEGQEGPERGERSCTSGDLARSVMGRGFPRSGDWDSLGHSSAYHRAALQAKGQPVPSHLTSDHLSLSKGTFTPKGIFQSQVSESTLKSIFTWHCISTSITSILS